MRLSRVLYDLRPPSASCWPPRDVPAAISNERATPYLWQEAAGCISSNKVAGASLSGADLPLCVWICLLHVTSRGAKIATSTTVHATTADYTDRFVVPLPLLFLPVPSFPLLPSLLCWATLIEMRGVWKFVRKCSFWICP